ncbi:class I SAM-dependent methyltransferase [bacterium]|nr:class I SAM-dependent methyltransferase [bacterium]
MFHVKNVNMEKINNCPICDNNSFIDFMRIKDYFLSQEEFTVQECKKCGFRFVNPRPAPENLQKYYMSENYISHSDTKKGIINKAYHFFRNYNLSRKYKYISQNIQKGNILDIGCATAAFLKYCKNKNWNVSGIEPNENARDFAKKNNGIEVKSETELKNFENNFFDVITLWHVLEHVDDLNFYFSEIKRIIKKNGTVFIAVPNHLSFDAFKYKNYWAAWDVPRHLYHFTQESMNNLSKKYDFCVSDIIPMKLDAFYVSLLSEKYLKGKSNYFSAFITGLKSNIKARKNMNNYSSLIYVLKNKMT